MLPPQTASAFGLGQTILGKKKSQIAHLVPNAHWCFALGSCHQAFNQCHSGCVVALKLQAYTTFGGGHVEKENRLSSWNSTILTKNPSSSQVDGKKMYLTAKLLEDFQLFGALGNLHNFLQVNPTQMVAD
jgi:hypothetical protein